MKWWYGDWERKGWLLWILFMGAVASNGRTERFWFVQELGKVCSELGIGGIKGSGGPRERLDRVVLQDIFFEWHLVAIWEDVLLFGETDRPLGAVDLEGTFEDEVWN